MSSFRELTDEQVEHFVTRGYVVVPGCFSPAAAAGYTDSVWTRLGYDPDDRSTWTRPSIHMPAHRDIDVREFAPRAWNAICDLVGGAERISTTKPYHWNDAFIVNLGEGADREWEPPSAAWPGWHKDGDFFRHYLDSPEQGLLTLVLWTPVRHQGGATFMAADSVAPVARFLAAHPEGVYPPMFIDDPAPGVPGAPPAAYFDYGDLVGRCSDFVEATGAIGDVYLIHPYVLHAKGSNTLRLPRYITNPPVSLAEPLRFDRRDPDEFSPVERAILRALDVERYDFAPAGPREALVPPRVAQQRRMKEEEAARLATA
jgi:hypothetical protein